MQCVIESGGLRLSGYLVRPESYAPVPGLVLCHGFPAGPGGAATSGQTYPQLADRLSADTGWAVLTFNFRGTGASEGDFSLAGEGGVGARRASRLAPADASCVQPGAECRRRSAQLRDD